MTEHIALLELRCIRNKLQERLQSSRSTAGCLLQDVHNAFSKLRLAAANLVTENTENNQRSLINAAEAVEAACRHRLNALNHENILFLEDALCHSKLALDQKSVIKNKAREFDDLKFSEINISSSQTQLRQNANKEAQPGINTFPEGVKYDQSVELRSDDFNNWNVPFSTSISEAMSKRPATSLGIARNWGLTTPAKLYIGTIDCWPTQSTKPRPISPFCGSSELPNRGHLAGPSGVTKLAISDKRESICDKTLPDTSRSKEMVRIEKFIELEFRKRKCSLDLYNEDRYSIFHESFKAVIRTFRSWAPLLTTIQREYDEFVLKLKEESLKVQPLQDKLIALEKDYSVKNDLLRTEAEKILEKEKMHSSSQIIALSQSLNEAICQRNAAECSLVQEKSKAAYLSDQLAEAQRQQALLLKGYNEQMRDLTRMMDATGVSSVNDLIKRFREMVHIQALWELEARLQEEKACIKLEKDLIAIKLLESEASSKNSAVRTQAAEQKYLEISKEQESILKYFPAQFPEATELKISGGKPCILGPDGKLRDATLKSALLSLRRSLNIRNEMHEDAVRERKNLKLKLHGLRHLIEAAEEQWKPADFFDGLGDGPYIPAILRAHGRIKNRHLSKAQTERAVKQILNKRLKGELYHQEDCWTTILHYAGQNYGTRSVEWGYSFLDALKKYSADTDIGCFYKILTGKFGEAVYWRTTEVFVILQSSLKQRDEHLHKPARGKLPRKEFIQAVTDFFQPAANGGSGILKSRARLEELWHELDKDERSSNQWGVSDKEIQYVKLFSETKDGSQSHFVEMLRRQILEELNEYLSDISCTVERYRSDHLATTTALELRQAIRKIDPDKSLDQCEKLVHEVFGRKVELPHHEFQSKLRLLLAERTTDRTDPRVHRALRPKSQLLLTAERKVRQVRLYVRVINAFRSYQKDLDTSATA